MKKITPALQRAYDKKKKTTLPATETRVTMEIMEYFTTGGFALVIRDGTKWTVSVPLLEYEAREIAKKAKVPVVRLELPRKEDKK